MTPALESWYSTGSPTKVNRQLAHKKKHCERVMNLGWFLKNAQELFKQRKGKKIFRKRCLV